MLRAQSTIICMQIAQNAPALRLVRWEAARPRCHLALKGIARNLTQCSRCNQKHALLPLSVFPLSVLCIGIWPQRLLKRCGACLRGLVGARLEIVKRESPSSLKLGTCGTLRKQSWKHRKKAARTNRSSGFGVDVTSVFDSRRARCDAASLARSQRGRLLATDVGRPICVNALA